MHCFDIDIVLFTIFNHLLTAGEGLAEISIAPGGEDFKIGGEGGKGELETALIISFPVAPWASAVAPNSRAISICAFAINGRAIDVPSNDGDS